MQLTVIFSLFFATAIALFAVLNSKVVEVNLIFVKQNLSLAIVILVSAVFGAVIMYLLNIFKSVKKRVKMKNLEKQNLILNNEVRKLGTQLDKFEQNKEKH